MAPQQERPAGPGVAGERGGSGGGDGGQTGAEKNKPNLVSCKIGINNLIPGAFYRAAAAAPGGRAGEGGAAAAATTAGAADRPRQDKLLQQVVLRADTTGARTLISRTQIGIQN